VVVTIHDDDDHLFPALQAGAFGYLLKEQARELIGEQQRDARRAAGAACPALAVRDDVALVQKTRPQERPQNMPHVALTDREHEVLLRVAKGFTLPEIGVQLNLSRHTIADYVKQIYRKLNVSSRAEAALEAQRLGLFRR
jgi:DNA-binding NarL/FixJ family response regulator